MCVCNCGQGWLNAWLISVPQYERGSKMKLTRDKWSCDSSVRTDVSSTVGSCMLCCVLQCNCGLCTYARVIYWWEPSIRIVGEVVSQLWWMKRISTTKPVLTHIANSLLVLNWFKLLWFHCELTKPYRSVSNCLVSLTHVNTLNGLLPATYKGNKCFCGDNEQEV